MHSKYAMQSFIRVLEDKLGMKNTALCAPIITVRSHFRELYRPPWLVGLPKIVLISN